MQRELRYLLPAWFTCLFLPLPFLLFWHSPEGRSVALKGFFLGCMIPVAYSFRLDVRPLDEAEPATPVWCLRMSPLSVALLAAFGIFSVVCLLLNNPHDFGTPEAEEDQGIWWRAFVFDTPHDFVAPILALMTLVPSLCIVPYFVLLTRKPLAAVVFTALLVGCMKLLGATVVVLIYGWDADAQGRTKMPWNHPDLLVWLFWCFSAALSLVFYLFGANRFRVVHERAAS